MRASRFECLSFDPFHCLKGLCCSNGCIASEVDVGGRDVVQTLVVTLVVIVIDECFDPRLQIPRQGLVFQQDAILQGLMPAFDLTLGLWVIRCAM